MGAITFPLLNKLNHINVVEIDSDMINLIGCNKENFIKLLDLMEYRSIKNVENNEGEYFAYKPKFIKNNKKKIINKTSKNSAFDKLSELRLR